MNINLPDIGLPRIVIIGGGFGGLMLAKTLNKKLFQVVLIDKNNYHTFQPLLYQVATAGLEADSIAFPLRKIFKTYQHFHFRMAKVEKIIPQENRIATDIGNMRYDYLVIASGSQTNYFGMDKIKEFALPMKSLEETLHLRSYILQNFEIALNTVDLAEKDSLMNYVIVGGGPTGVELAGALSELKKDVLPNDFPELDFSQMQIFLLEASPRLLISMDEKSSDKSAVFLKNMGVNVLLNTAVTDYDGNMVQTNADLNIKSKTLIWTAGVMGENIMGIDPSVINRGGRIEVNEYNIVKGYSNVFAIGDVAAMCSGKCPKAHPMVAQVAIQQGDLLARNIEKLFRGKSLDKFVYVDKGSMATIGRNKAVVEISNYKTQGIFAWFIWMFVHLIALVGFRNKLVVFINWALSYFNYDKGIRLIINPLTRKRTENKNEIYRKSDKLAQ